MGLLIPVRSQLSAIVFAKTMRKKDIKGAQKEKDAETMGTKNNDDAASTSSKGDDKDELKNMKQGTINLLAVDSSRIAEFTAFSNIFAESFFGMLFGFSLLIGIIGSVTFSPTEPGDRKLTLLCILDGGVLSPASW